LSEGKKRGSYSKVGKKGRRKGAPFFSSPEEKEEKEGKKAFPGGSCNGKTGTPDQTPL